nr:retrovirus-related Pol polyprotein from transposon TNT 1-94 [Tanacetum cinerariifolium]
MSRDVLIVGSIMRIPLLFRGEYSQLSERFMNYLEEQMDGEAMINSIKNGLPNDIYSLIDSNKTSKDLWDVLARHMLGSEYGEQDRKAVVLYEYETFKDTEGELLLDTYIRYLQVINDLKKCGYSKDNCELNFKFLNNFQPEWKQYVTMMRQNKNLTDINIDALYNILKQNRGDVNDAMKAKKKVVEKFYSKPTNNNLRTSSASISANKKHEYVKSDDKKEEKKVDEKKRDMSKVRCYNCKKEGYFAKDFKKAKVKDYEYYKTKMLLAKKNKDEQVLLTEDHTWMESSSDSDQEINANMVFIAQIEKVLSDSKASSSSSDDKIVEQMSSLKPYVPTVILEKIIIDLEDEVSENDCQVVENVCDDLENPNVIAPGMFKLSVSHSVSPIFVTKTSCASNSVETKLKRKRCKRSSSKHNVNQVNSVVSRANKDFVYFLDLDTFNSVRRPKPSDFIWKKKGSSNIVKVNLSYVNHSNVNKNAKRYSRINLMACNNSDTRSEFACNNARNAFCNSYDVDVNDLFVFDDVSIRKSQVSKMSFRKKPSASLIEPSRRKSLKSLPRIVRKWLPKMKPLVEPVAKWIPRICLWLIDSGCSKHMASNRALLKNFVEKFLGMVRFGNNDFAVIAGYRDVIIGSMMIKKIYYVEEFKNKKLATFFDEVGISQQFSAARTPQQNGVVERRNRTLVEAARTMLTFANLPLFLWAEAIAIACFTQNRSFIHKRFDKTPYELINIRKLNIKFFHVFGCRCYLLNDYGDVGKLKAKGDIEVFVGYSKDSAGFVSKQYPDHVYALDKALYGLKQAPQAWYAILSKFLIDSGFQKGLIDTTLFIKKKGEHIMVIQIYVDDIIFGSTNPKYCTKLSKLMEKRLR